MKKIIQTIKLRKFRTELNKSSLKGFTDNDLVEIRLVDKHCNGTCERAYSKYDLINILEKDHIKPIQYVFEMNDRILVDRDIKIDIKEVDKDV